MATAAAELVDLAVNPPNEPAEIDVVLDLDEADGEGLPEPAPEPVRTRSNRRIIRQQAELNQLRKTNRKLAADLSRAHRTIDTLIDGHRAAIAKMRDQLAAMGAP